MFFRGIIVALITALLDQASKFWILAVFAGPHEAIHVTPFFSLQLVWNPGISFGMFSSVSYSQWIFSALATAVIIMLLMWMRKATSPLPVYALALVIGGAVGNTVDRILHGAVVDFLDFYVGQYHWPAFNLADSTIFVGVVLLLWDGLLCGTPDKKEGSVQ